VPAPSGEVTLLFTDIEGSTRLWEAHPREMAVALARHDRLVRELIEGASGYVFKTVGDAFCAAFASASSAVTTASEVQRAVSVEPWPAETPIHVRMALHSGGCEERDGDYFGPPVNRVARLLAVAHGGQTLLSGTTRELVYAVMDASVSMRDLGQHRLKDLSVAEHVYQLGSEDFPPLRSLYRTNLPVVATPFVGRDREIEQVAALLARPDVRLVTLTGAGGSGKTRLALQAAGAAVDAFDGGVWWVPLAELRDPSLMLDAAARAVGAAIPLSEHIGTKCMLLVLDNFEHVIAAASGIGRLLGDCSQLTVLATSREPLHLEGEWQYAVDPLPASDAMTLFETRARAVRRDFETDAAVRDICARLDNLPLAIELAAARVKVLSPTAMLQRLERRLPLLAGAHRDAPERQQTLRSTIEWSYRLLSPAEQELFRQLSVFAGGCTLEAIVAVCDADLETVASLVDKSLVRVRDGERFSMLTVIRDHAAEQRDASGETDLLRRRHADIYATLADEAEPHLRAGAKECLDRLDEEHDNLRAALGWLADAGESQRLLRLAGALSRFWYLRGYLPEGRRRLEQALTTDERPTAARAAALNGAAVVAADPVTMRRRAEQGLELHRALGDAWGAGYSVLLLGYADAQEHQYARARRHFEESARTLRDMGDEHFALLASRNLAWMHAELGDHLRARALHEENLQRARSLRNERVEASSLAALAQYAFDEKRTTEARAMLARSLCLWRDLANRLEIAVTLTQIAKVIASDGHATIAAQLLSRAEALHHEIGAAIAPWVATDAEQTRNAIRAHLEAPAFEEATEQGKSLTTDEALELALNALTN
jgi:predicted ATPase/class 3 adenylate cyclase